MHKLVCVVFLPSFCVVVPGLYELFPMPISLQQQGELYSATPELVTRFCCDEPGAHTYVSIPPTEAISSPSPHVSCMRCIVSLSAGGEIRMETKVNLALREDASAKDRLQAMFQVRFPVWIGVRLPDISVPGGIKPGFNEGLKKASWKGPHAVDARALQLFSPLRGSFPFRLCVR